MRVWEKNVRKIAHPYVAGYQPEDYDVIKLNANENPYPPAPGVNKVISEFQAENLRLYPDLNSKELNEEIAKFANTSTEHVFTGVGSDDVLAIAFLTFFNSDKPILFPDITYSFYDVWADLYRIPYTCPALDENFRIKKEDYYGENGGIIIANPNAPTSLSEGLDFVRDILDHNKDSVVIIDEAYVDFGGTTALGLIKEYDNLLVVQTFSKSRSMAGIRIGYAIGSKALIEAMNQVKFSFNSYTMNMLTIKAGAESFRDQAYFDKIMACIVATREWVKEKFEMLGFVCLDSSTNFLFITHKNLNMKEIFLKLQEMKIYVRYFDKPRIDNYLRITIGTDEQMHILFDALEKII